MSQLNLVVTLHYAQTALAAYGLYASYNAISKFREWEGMTKLAATVSKTAEEQLHRTRTSQASSLFGVAASLLASLTLATAWDLLPHNARTLANPAMVMVTLLVRGHLDNFWKARLQLAASMAKGYAEALARTRQLMQALEFLEYSWVLTSVVGAALAYGNKGAVALG